MKKVFFAALLVVSAQAVFAQINKGQWLVGGSAGFESGKYGDVDESKYTSFELSPAAGYFFINNLAGGLRLNVSTTKYKEDDDAMSSFSLAPFVRYYFLPAGEKVNILADASYGFGSMKDGESESFDRFSFMAGPVVFLSPNTALEFTLGYTSAGGDAYGEDRQNNLGINIGFQIHLGGNAGK